MNLNSFWLGLGFSGALLGGLSFVLSLQLAVQDRGVPKDALSGWAFVAFALFLVAAACTGILFATLYNIAEGRDPQESET